MCRHKCGINTAKWTAASLSGPFIVRICVKTGLCSRRVQSKITQKPYYGGVHSDLSDVRLFVFFNYTALTKRCRVMYKCR
ncbi:hypothetical protein ALC53_03800 [Atta colombica]|uniref:Uncharacterized protein n=1 Tax=Atta colombica TaxID=520822 RepID=A0A195BND6_9HYME|nr:hypothetical protein ALC53_03800 [Atta colombica]